MREKAIVDLDQRRDSDLFGILAEGMRHIIEHAGRVERDAQALEQGEGARGARILRAVVEEEAAKYLILLDAARCPRGPDGRLAAHLRSFNDHLAKGIYAHACGWHAATFGELRRYVEMERDEYYLDGPNDLDWIFRNQILQRREDSFYVNYVENDGEHSWWSPRRDDELGLSFPTLSSEALTMARALDSVGVTDKRAIAEIADMWRAVVLDDDLHVSRLRDLNLDTLKRLDELGLLEQQPQHVYSLIINRWQFPLHSLDISVRKVKKGDLREAQRAWVP